MATREQVIICHSRRAADEAWRERLRDHLRPFERRNGWSTWDFSSINPGESYHDELAAALERARLVILLVTPDFLASELMAETGLPALLDAAEKKGVRIFWIAARPSSVKDSPLWQYPPLNEPDKPLSGLSRSDADAELVHISEQIARKHRGDSAEPADSFLYRYSRNPRSSNFAKIITILGLAMLPLAAFGASGAATHYQKLFISVGAMGGLYVVFGLFFANITMFPAQHRTRALGLLLGTFVLLTLILGARAAGYYYEGREAQSTARTKHINIPAVIERKIETMPDLLQAPDIADLATVDLEKADLRPPIIVSTIPQKPQNVSNKNCRDATQAEIDAARQRLIDQSMQELHRPGDSMPGETEEEKTTRLSQKFRARIPSDREIAANLRSELCGGPSVIAGTAEVRGTLDRDLIKRIVNRHSKEIKPCYEAVRLNYPELSGLVSVQFIIDVTGRVRSTAVQSSTFGDLSVEKCIANTVKKWEFPKPQGGIVIITYPFEIPILEDRKLEEKQEGMSIVSRVIKQHKKEIDWCAKEARKQDPSLTGGLIRLHFTINMQGSVDDAKIESSTLGSTKADDCIIRQMNRWVFPKPNKNPFEIRYPIKIEP